MCMLRKLYHVIYDSIGLQDMVLNSEWFFMNHGHVILYSVDLEVWSKLAKHARIKGIASKLAHDFECNLQRVNALSHCITLTRVLLLQIISYSDTKVSVLLVMECKRVCVIYVYKMIFSLHTSRSTRELKVLTGTKGWVYWLATLSMESNISWSILWLALSFYKEACVRHCDLFKRKYCICSKSVTSICSENGCIV